MAVHAAQHQRGSGRFVTDSMIWTSQGRYVVNRVVQQLSARQPISEGRFDLAPIAAALSDAGTKVLAMTAAASSAGMMMNVRIFVENPAAANEALNAAQIRTSESEALSLRLPNRQGALTQLTAGLGPANSKIEAMTVAASSAGRMLNVLMLVDNPARAIDALETKLIE